MLPLYLPPYEIGHEVTITMQKDKAFIRMDEVACFCARTYYRNAVQTSAAFVLRNRSLLYPTG